MAPPPKFQIGGGPLMYLAPPIFRENSVMYTINVQCFSLKKNNSGMHAYVVVVYIVQCSLVQDTAVYTYTHKFTCMTC